MEEIWYIFSENHLKSTEIIRNQLKSLKSTKKYVEITVKKAYSIGQWTFN